MERSLSAANYFIKKSLETGKEITPMKLVKLVYLAHGWNLGINGNEPLNEGIEAWKYGPVVPTIYHRFKSYGSHSINQADYDPETKSIPIVSSPDLVPLLDKIWDVYGDMTGLQLSTLTHQPNTPWDIIWNQQEGKKKMNALIPNAVIEDHYKKKIAA